MKLAVSEKVVQKELIEQNFIYFSNFQSKKYEKYNNVLFQNIQLRIKT